MEAHLVQSNQVLIKKIITYFKSGSPIIEYKALYVNGKITAHHGPNLPNN